MLVYNKERFSGAYITKGSSEKYTFNLFGNFINETPNSVSAFLYPNKVLDCISIVCIHPKEYFYPLVFKI